MVSQILGEGMKDNSMTAKVKELEADIENRKKVTNLLQHDNQKLNSKVKELQATLDEIKPIIIKLFEMDVDEFCARTEIGTLKDKLDKHGNKQKTLNKNFY